MKRDRMEYYPARARARARSWVLVQRRIGCWKDASKITKRLLEDRKRKVYEFCRKT